MTDANDSDFSYSWRIESLSILNLENSFISHSPFFTVPIFGNSVWNLELRGSVRTLSLRLCKFARSEENVESIGEIAVSSKIQIMMGKISKEFTGVNMLGRGYEISTPMNVEELFEEMNNSRSDTLIVYFSVRRLDGVMTLDKRIEARSKFLMNRFLFYWRPQFFKCSHSVIGRIYFCLGNMFYKMEAQTDQEEVTISIHNLLNNSSNILVIGEITLMDGKGDKLVSLESIHYFEHGKDAWVFNPAFTRNLFREELKKIVKDCEIVLQCDFLLHSENQITDPKTETEFFSNIRCILNFMDDFRKLYFSRNTTDVELKVDNKVVKANRCVLAARSPVFSAMFNSDMLESRTGNVDIKDVGVDTLLSFLRFLYTGEIESLDCERALKLVLIADKYQVDFLKEECCSFLILNICVKNVCIILQVADMVQHAPLKRRCLDFIATNFTGVFKSMQWSQMTKKNAELVTEVKSYLEKHSKNSYILNKIE